MHVWKRGGGKQAWRDNFSLLIDGIVGTVNSGASTDEWLIVHHKFNKQRFAWNIPAAIRSRVDRKLHFVHWGDHSATNAFRDVKNVLLAGTLFCEPSYYESLGRLSQQLKSNEILAEDDYDQIVAGEHAHFILQALCRGSVRKCDGVKCAPCDAYIIADPRSGIPAMLRDGTIFPGCSVVECAPVKKELSGRVASAIAYISACLCEGGEKKVTLSDVRKHLKVNDRSSFSKEVIGHRNFKVALAEHGIVLVAQKGQNGSYFRLKHVDSQGIEKPF